MLTTSASASTIIFDDSYKGLPTNWSSQVLNCKTMAESSPSLPHVKGPGTPPAGSGSLKVALPAASFGGIGRDFPAGTNLSDLNGFDAWVYFTSTDFTPSMNIDASDSTYSYSFYVDANAASPNTWQHVNAGTAQLQWESTKMSDGSDGPAGTNTLADFLATHSGVSLDSVSITGGVCATAGAFNVDKLTLGVADTWTITDFEAPFPSTVANFSRPTSVPTGTVVTLGARLTHSNAPGAAETVSLYAHSATNSTYRLVKSLTADSTGAVSMKVAPSSTTTYQWRYSGANTNNAAANAPAFTIASRQRVAVTTKPTSAGYNTNAVLKGRITPNTGGVTVRLVRLVNGQRIVVASAKTVYGGYFTIKAPMKVRGTSTYLVSALPYPGQDLGQSATFKIATK
jgi:hypothetical protein